MHPPPSIEDLSQRIDILFGVAEPVDRAPAPADDSPDISEEVDAALLKHFGKGGAARKPDPSAAVDAWLDTPNPTFGGCCPRAFLNGTDDQKAFLDGVLSSLEDGAFS